MSSGGGFCELHGPFDPPHTTCPFCAQAEQQRRAYGPPIGGATRRADPDEVPPGTGGVPPGDDFARRNNGQETARPGDDAIDHAGEHGPIGGFQRRTVDGDSYPGGNSAASDSASSDAAPSGQQRSGQEDGAPAIELTEIIPQGARSARRAELQEISADAEPDEAADLPLGWLIVKAPPERRGEVLRVGHNQVIGRAGDVVWDDPRLSRYHARITLEPLADDPTGEERFHLWPFGPTNPVYINEVEVRGATPLQENDVIRLGDTLFIFKVMMD